MICLVVWNIFFPYIGNNHPNWRAYFSEGFKPPTSDDHPSIFVGGASFSDRPKKRPIPSGVMKHGWQIPFKWRFLDGKIIENDGFWSHGADTGGYSFFCEMIRQTSFVCPQSSTWLQGSGFAAWRVKWNFKNSCWPSGGRSEKHQLGKTMRM